MPELPEVETVRRQLVPVLRGKTIDSIEVFHAKTVGHDETIEDVLRGKTIDHIDRIGKLLIVSFIHQPNIFLLAHLKMTGQFFYEDRSEHQLIGGGHSLTPTDSLNLPNQHTRVSFIFKDGSNLYFNDMRLFGYTKLADARMVDQARAGFGPEPIDVAFDVDWFSTSIRIRKTLVKAALLDQTFVAGLGNIYVDETLWRAQVRPTRRANRLTKREARLIGIEAGSVMREAIAVGGTTFQNFVDTNGKNGNFTDYLQVFGKQGSACSRCTTTIKKIRVAGRGTHYCPGCQK